MVACSAPAQKCGKPKHASSRINGPDEKAKLVEASLGHQALLLTNSVLLNATDSLTKL
jgi:hypothetical protein